MEIVRIVVILLRGNNIKAHESIDSEKLLDQVSQGKIYSQLFMIQELIQVKEKSKKKRDKLDKVDALKRKTRGVG